MSESYICQPNENAHRKTRKIKVLLLGSNEKKNSEKDLREIEGTEVEQKMNSLKIKLQKCYSVKSKVNS